ncbi:MAG TPA: hypothetical protein VD837_06880 [Terriglobales bacterium]|nr:hypothetical protein [Terriglobales bacterium]
MTGELHCARSNWQHHPMWHAGRRLPVKHDHTLLVLFGALVAFCVLVDLPVTWNNVVNERFALYHKFAADPGGGIPWHKAGKDLLFFLLAAVVVCRHNVASRLSQANRTVLGAWLAVLLAAGVALANTLVSVSPMVALVGLRTNSPLLMLLVGLTLRDDDVRGLYHVVGGLAVFEALFGAYQYSIGVRVYGATLGYRVTGSFYDPNTYALFAICCVLLLSTQPRARIWYVYLFSAMTIVLTSGSRMGFSVLALWIVFYCVLRMRSTAARVLVSLVAIPMIFYIPGIVDVWAQRGSFYDNLNPHSERLGIMLEYLHSTTDAEILIGRGLGTGANVLHTDDGVPLAEFGADLTVAFLTDSMYTATMAQGGLILLICLLSLLASPWIAAKRGEHRYSTLMRLMPMLALLAGTSMNLTEAAPFNYVLFALYGFVAARTGAPLAQLRD